MRFSALIAAALSLCSLGLAAPSTDAFGHRHGHDGHHRHHDGHHGHHKRGYDDGFDYGRYHDGHRHHDGYRWRHGYHHGWDY